MQPTTAVLIAACTAASIEALALLFRRIHRRTQTLQLVVSQRTDPTPDLFSITLRRPRGSGFLPLPRFAAGQSIAIAIPGQPLKRRYSIARWDAQPTAYELTIKREAQGRFSPRLAEYAQPGAHLLVGKPGGGFTLAQETSAKRAVLIAGGVGITPLLAMLDEWVATRRHYTEAHLFWQLRHERDACYQGTLATLTKEHPDVRVHLLISRPSAGEGERLDAALLAKELGSFASTDFYLCAGSGLLESLRAGLGDAGVSPSALHFERFTLANGAVDASHEGATVTYQGKSFPFAGHPSLLDAIEAQRLPIDSDCRTGCCGRCLVGVEEGEATYRFKPEHPVPDKHLLACCAVPSSDLRLSPATP
jgi:uncharacterized protein